MLCDCCAMYLMKRRKHLRTIVSACDVRGVTGACAGQMSAGSLATRRSPQLSFNPHLRKSILVSPSLAHNEMPVVAIDTLSSTSV